MKDGDYKGADATKVFGYANYLGIPVLTCCTMTLTLKV